MKPAKPLIIVKAHVVKFSAAPLIHAAKVFGAANFLGWGISAATKSHLHLDLIGTGAFIVAAATALPGPTAAFGLTQKISAALIGTWATRLTSFLFYRALQVRHDDRLDELLSTIPGTTVFWGISFVWGVVCFLPHALAASLPGQGLGPIGAAGAAIALTGLCVEALADVQKWTFKQDPANRGKFCDVGLWGSSQHPNYFGNLMLWTGIVVLNGPRLMGAAWALPVACLCPLFLYALFNAQAGGSTAKTKELTLKKYGDDPRFKSYQETTPLIFPWGKPGPQAGPSANNSTVLYFSAFEPSGENVEAYLPVILTLVVFIGLFKKFGRRRPPLRELVEPLT